MPRLLPGRIKTLDIGAPIIADASCITIIVHARNAILKSLSPKETV